MIVISMVDMSTFRHVNVSSMSPGANTARNTGISRFKTFLKHSRIRRVPSSAGAKLSPNWLALSTFISHIRVIIHMNTKMILAAIALSLSLVACAKKEPAEAAQDSAAQAQESAGQAQEAAGDAQQAAGDAAAAAGDAAATPPADGAAPAEQPPAQPQQQ
jgi:hypothetical protein